MSIASQQISVGSGSAVLLAEASVDRPLTVYLKGLGSTYLGGSNVTSSNGFIATNLPSLPLTLQPGDALYAVTDSGTQAISVLTLGGE